MPVQGFSSQQKQELKDIVSAAVDSKLKVALKPIKKELAKLRPMQKDIRKIKSDQILYLNHLDRRIIDLDERVDKLEGKPSFN